MSPAGTCRNLTAARAEVAGIAADATASPQEVGAMAGRTMVDIKWSLISVEIRTVRIEPILPGDMVCTDMTIMAGDRTAAETPHLIMAGVTDIKRAAQAVVRC